MKKILILAANPNQTTRLRLDQEVRDIEDGLSRSRQRDDFQLVPKGAVRPRDIQRAMLNETPQIVHFSGHGEGEEGLVFEDDTGNPQLVRSEALAGLFQLFANYVECVLLNGCYSQVQAEAIVQHIDYVIGMKQAISDRAAIEFAVAFYDALGAGRTYEFAYQLACNAIQLNASSTSPISARKLVPIDGPGKSQGEHLIPVLLKRPGAEIQEKKANLEANLLSVESAGQARIHSLNEQIAEEERKLQETVDAHVKEALAWLKTNEKKLSQGARNNALEKSADIFKNLSADDQDDFQWEIEKYIESVYFAMLSDSFDLLDDPVIKPSINNSKVYETAFEFIKSRILTRLNQKAKELVFERFDYLLTRLFV